MLIHLPRVPAKNKFVAFWTMSEEEILKIIMSTSKKSGDLVYSLQEDSFSSYFKTAHVTPLLKKAGLYRYTLTNYRPVSNLSYSSKLIEKAVDKQINQHIAHDGISNINLSVCRAFYSTETALQKIQNDIATSDKSTAVGLVLLDLSTAFDTIDHSILFDCLQHWYCFRCYPSLICE